MTYHSDGSSARFTVLRDLVTGGIMIPADSATALLRETAGRWVADIADPHQPPRDPAFYASALLALADQIDAECIGVELRPLADE
ncbi:hypothetical protein [Kitasatospora fiedleri]|uniref:hypothetical protein n=1 Tax=Kitasatospora fiedleri TaxID=2991545 RepID=UPI00249C1E1D|nr:hypothetical protein [Kitasatospora fiedleri]